MITEALFDLVLICGELDIMWFTKSVQYRYIKIKIWGLWHAKKCAYIPIKNLIFSQLIGLPIGQCRVVPTIAVSVCTRSVLSLTIYVRRKLLGVSVLVGQQKLLPPSSMSLISVSIGVLPISFIKKRFSTAAGFISLRAGIRRSRRPALPGWLLYCMRSYSSSEAYVFSCKFCMVPGSCSPGTSEDDTKQCQLLLSI